MKLSAIALLCLCNCLQAATLVIDDFSHAQGVHSSSSNTGSPRETSDSSIFGEYRRSLANGYVPIRFVDGNILPGDSAGFSSIDISDGTMMLSKSAPTGSAFVSYNGRAFTSGNRIGDLNLDISGGLLSLGSPILFVGHSVGLVDQNLSFSLSSAVDTASSFDILLRAGATETFVDLREITPTGIGMLGAADFANIEDILIGLGNGDPVGSVQLEAFGFVPEPSAFVFLGSGLMYSLLRRSRKITRSAACPLGLEI
jgi:hypothetical protein